MREYTQEEADQITDRLTAKADRLDGWSETNKAKANDRHQASNNAVAGIPFGQPILAGHHSAKRHRNALERARNNMDKAVEHDRKASRQADKADRLRSIAQETQRRAKGPRYAQADLQPGDRLVLKGEKVTGIVVRANAKSVTAWCCYTHAPTDLSEPRPIWPQFEDLNPQRYKYLAVRSAYRLVDGAWSEIEPA